ncbi:MAG: N-acetylmuramoyl-L-alanine amidase [Candidatus Marinimicrobia bacterium]|mgnify:FL=1|nr:N-acetylmuramoyl-L-alanine amidase [Candidatus Neomarinimicrobiota bacterium]MBT3683703.1 N-acetylmuramoyl-L-alanine amidase [Candidatus Neomarinimicrobiota bacterium]MBT3760702.1 N-acetylmuramoyl-L-alanine amidase [Candidatus Neomarinimicrobiota bacterium]MBT3896740.1 N-acetylmuramoyl-L-alanine amidase [Candidatus Neomarinimicrobiota bacterium]MBT4173798.1 N-acetylmuramoyl-L-alanine amidase [Candidatus Neomarinimicrobiota bacterium]
MTKYKINHRRNLSIYFISALLIWLITLLYGQQSDGVKSQVHTINGKKYIALTEFAKNQSVRTEFYEHNNKMVLRFPSKKTVVSAYCSFVRIEEKNFQLPYPVLYDGSEFFIAAAAFSNLLNIENISDAVMDPTNSIVISTAPKYNLHNIRVNKKSNGSQISIRKSATFKNEELAVSFSRGGWLNLTIPGGKPDSIGVIESHLSDPVVRVRTMNTGVSCQLSFLLRYQIEDYELKQTKDEIQINLRTDISDNAKKIREMRNRWMMNTIVIDAGHGGKDGGCIGVTKLLEKTVTLDIAKRLGKLIEKDMGVKVVYTRDEDVFIPLWKRTKIANEANGKVFISIHANSTPRITNARGYETYLLRPGRTEDAIEVATRENAVISLEENVPDFSGYSDENLILATMAQSSFMKESEYLASVIQEQLTKLVPSKDRGVKQAGFHVLVGASMPNVLVEVGFLSNRQECANLGKASYRRKITQAIFNALVIFKDKYESPIIDSN